jgi:hypothetical protein
MEGLLFVTLYSVCQNGKVNLPVFRHIINLFGKGRVDGPTQNDHYELVISGVKNVVRIYAYFNSVNFVGIKGRSFRLFKEVNVLFAAKAHLTPQNRPAILKRCREINVLYKQELIAKRAFDAWLATL